MSDAQAFAVSENIEMDPLGLPNDKLQTRGPWATGQDDCQFLSVFVDLFSRRSIWRRRVKLGSLVSTDVFNFVAHNSTVFASRPPECLPAALVIAGPGC